MNCAFLAKKLKVGFQKRRDTYSGKLAYIIYYDEKNKLRKETSWNSWIDKSVAVEEFDNIPLEGFVLNKKVGGYSDWFYRQSYIRVYDPRGFEFEITVNNLLYILENTNCIKGKGLEGKFCYGWIGTELVLLPECSLSYKESLKYTENIFNPPKIKNKDLHIGSVYTLKNNNKVVYLGRYDQSFDSFGRFSCDGNKYVKLNTSKKHFYLDVDYTQDCNYWNIKECSSFKPLECLEETMNLEKVMEIFNDRIAYTGEVRIPYTKKELEKLITKDVKEIKTMRDGFPKTYKIYFDGDIAQIEYYDLGSYRRYPIDWIPFELHYIGEFVNGKLVNKKNEIILVK